MVGRNCIRFTQSWYRNAVERGFTQIVYDICIVAGNAGV